METDEQRYESMSTLRGSQVTVVIRKRVTKEYVNYIAEVIDVVVAEIDDVVVAEIDDVVVAEIDDVVNM